MEEEKEDKMYQVLVDKVFERCQEVQLENERLVFRTNKVKKLVQRCNRDIELLKRRLDRYNDNWRTLPMVLPHPKRKIEQKRGPKPKNKQGTTPVLTTNTTTNTQNVQVSDGGSTNAIGETGKKVRKQRMRKADRDTSLNQQEASLLRQQQQQKKQELQKQRQREQQALKLAAQQQKQLLRQQKQIAAQHLKQQRQLQRQQQRSHSQQQKKIINSSSSGTSTPNSPPGRFVTKVSTTFLTPQRSMSQMNTKVQSITGDVIMPPPPPPPKVDAHYTEQQAQLLLMHRPLQITTLKNQQQKPKLT